jgi:integrase
MSEGRALATVRLEYVNSYRDRHGKVRHYYRRQGARIALPGRPGEAEFMRAYAEAAAEFSKERPSIGKPPATGTVNALITAYYASTDWLVLRDTTRKTYKGIIERWRSEHGEKPVARVERRHITQQIADTFKSGGPHAANRRLIMLRGLFRFAVANDWRRDDPTTGIKPLRTTSGGFVTWTEDDIAAFEKRWPKGTRERLALALLLYTGQRRGDVVGMGFQHVSGDTIRVVQNKTGAALTIPLHPELGAVLAKASRDHLSFLTTGKGKSFSAAGFGNWFREACDKAELKERSAHGLRKAAARRLAEAGCSVLQIAAITGHKTLKEISRYTAGADQARLARDAVGMMTPKTEKRTVRTQKRTRSDIPN